MAARFTAMTPLGIRLAGHWPPRYASCGIRIAERLVGPDVVVGVAEEVDLDGEGVAVVDAGAARNGLVHADIDGAC
jgi:hypothetical protein